MAAPSASFASLSSAPSRRRAVLRLNCRAAGPDAAAPRGAAAGQERKALKGGGVWAPAALASIAAAVIQCSPANALQFNEVAQVAIGGEDIMMMVSNKDKVRDEQAAIRMYAGTFMEKMLGELNGGEEKTVAHVRDNLVPYLQGGSLLPEGLRPLRNANPAGLAGFYDGIGVDGRKLADLLLSYVPQADAEMVAEPAAGEEGGEGGKVEVVRVLKGTPGRDAAEQVDAMFEEIWASGSLPALYK